MTKIRDNSTYPGSVPNVKNAAAINNVNQAKVKASVDKQRAGSVGTQLKTFVARNQGGKGR
jgi:hypothetical protein